MVKLEAKQKDCSFCADVPWSTLVDLLHQRVYCQIDLESESDSPFVSVKQYKMKVERDVQWDYERLRVRQLVRRLV